VVLTDVNLPLESGKEMHGIVRSLSGSGDAPILSDSVVLSAEGTSVSSLESLREGDDVSFSLQLSPPFDQALEAVGGGPRLLRNGRLSVEAEGEGFDDNFSGKRNPRSAVGFDGSRLFLLTIDGRQKGYSIGATLEETARILQDLGAKEGMNLDGGGSTTLVAQRKILNSPSDGVERPVANSILTIRTVTEAPPQTLTINRPVLHIAAGSSFKFSLETEDNLGSEVAPGAITWVLNPPQLGNLTQDGTFVAGNRAGSGLVKAFSKKSDAKASAEVIVHDGVASLEIQPSSALLFPGEQLNFRLVAHSLSGEEVALSPVNPNALLWNTDNGLGSADSQGRFIAFSPGVTKVNVFFQGLKAEATVFIGGSVVELEDFENISQWSPSSYPDEVPATFRQSGSLAHSGAHSGRLLYDFTTMEVTRAAYAVCDFEIGKPRAISIWVLGDGSGHWLRASLKDSSGQRLVVDFARQVDWKDEWREVTAFLPEAGYAYPLHLVSVYLAEPDPEKRDEGAIYFDDLRALY
jgi:hypothetical protein